MRANIVLDAYAGCNLRAWGVEFTVRVFSRDFNIFLRLGPLYASLDFSR